MSDSPILRVEHLTVRFGDYEPVSDISFELARGMALAIVGPNGAGKSTLIRALLSLVPYEGTMAWAQGARIGYVPQRLSVDREFPMTAMEFLRFRGSEEEINRVLSLVGIQEAPFLQNSLGRLSGGELQKILVAWALISNPNILLFDEPAANIDVSGEETIYSLLSRLHTKEGMTIILISHDIDVVFRYADSVLCLNKRQIAFGAPDDALTPHNLEQLYGQAAFFKHHHS